MATITVASLNTNGIRDNLKRKRTFEYCKNLKADLILLQESHITPDDRELWSYEWGGPLFASYGNNFSCGTLTLVAPHLSRRISKVLYDPGGRLVCITLSFPSSKLQVCNIYAPNQPSNRKVFFNSLSSYISGNIPCILVGDFNCVSNRNLDKKNTSAIGSNTGIVELTNFTDTHRMHDVWRNINPTLCAYTWLKPDGSDASRLDRFYTALHTFSCVIIDCPLSDHNAILGTFKLPNDSVRGKGYWKFNNKILLEEDFISLLTDCYKDWQTLKSAFPSITEWWEDVKGRIKRLTIKYCVKRARSQRELFLLLCSRSHPKSDLEQHLDENFQRAKIKSRASCISGEEQPSSAFFKLLATDLAAKHISAVRDHTGLVISDPKGINKVYENYYRNLFASKDTDPLVQTTLLENISHTTPTELNETLSAPLSGKELRTALRGMKNNRAPGSDGLTKEFYHTFWSIISLDLLEVYQTSFEKSELPASQKEGIVTLLPKKGDNLDPCNKRPITLLNVDYKILAKSLSSRLAKVMPQIISPFQTCSVQGHSIHQNLWFLRDLIYYATDRNLPCAVLSLDQEKAFDRVDQAFLWKVMSKFNLDSTFIKWVQLLYNGVSGKVIVNGFISDPFPIKCGVRQGCPLSPLLYVLFCEVLISLLHKCEKFKGFFIPGGLTVKCLAYADDISCFVSDYVSFRAIKTLLQQFEQATGAKLNIAKTCGLQVGKWKRERLPFEATWSNDILKINGIWFGCDNAINKTWDDCIVKLQNKLQQFKGRYFTLVTKVKIINTFILPVLVYPSMVYPFPDKYIKLVEKLIFSFIWSEKTELVTRKMIYRPTNEGGLGLLHFSSRMSFSLCKQVYDAVINDTTPHAYFLRFYCGISLRNSFPPLFCPTGPHVSINRPLYYTKIIETFSRLSLHKIDFSKMSLSRVYSVLKKISLGPVQYREDLWHLSEDHIWENVNCPLFDNRLRDLSWRIAHNALVTNLKRKHWGLGEGICPRVCLEFESIPHIFWECSFVNELWDWYQHFARQYCLGWRVTEAYALFGLNQPMVNKKDKDLLLLIAAYVRRRVWNARCCLVFDKINITPESILNSVKNDIKLHIRADFVRLNQNTFRKRYTKSTGFVHIENGSLKFTL